jgi:pumilio RNA-binding family
MINFAVRNIQALLSSSSGSVYLAECFTNARGDELRMLEGFLLASTTEIATGQYSNYFMQRAIEVGREDFKERVAQRVAAEVAALAGDKFGSYVVEACFLLACSLTPMRCVLNAFLSLPTEQLAEMVKGDYSNYVVHKLLVACKTVSTTSTSQYVIAMLIRRGAGDY